MGVLADLQLPQVGKKMKFLILPEFVRDHVARGGEGALSPSRARGGAPLIPGRYISWKLKRLIVGIG